MLRHLSDSLEKEYELVLVVIGDRVRSTQAWVYSI